MKIFWLNESLVLRGESEEEIKALAGLYSAKITRDEVDYAGSTAESPDDAVIKHS